jgi:twitching motility protein PilJ
MQTAFFQNFLIRFSSFLSIVFLAIGLVFLFASNFEGVAGGAVSLPIITGGAILAICSLVAANLVNSRLDKELKETLLLASQIAEGDFTAEFEENEGEIKTALKEISSYLEEKSALIYMIANGDLSGKITLRSEADHFGKAFGNMLENLRVTVQTEEERACLQKSILKLLGEVSEVAAGDLTVSAEVTPEITGAIAEAFNSMTSELRSVIGQVKDVTFQVSASANAINDTTEQLARGSEAQASQISRTTSAIANMALQNQEVSSNAALSAQVAADSLNNARYGTKAVQDNIGAMNSIRRQVQETAKRIKKLGERSQEISQTVELIDDLSDRTSLLALNASLQAAAAGESGRGFAVVAEEVERLAERSSRLTQQIAALAQSIQSETKDVVGSMEETIHEVVVGSALADKAGQTLIEIEQVSGRLAELIQSISESAKHQADSSEDISKAMANISKVTELVQLGSKRAADSVKMLVELSDELRSSVAPFKLPNDKHSRRKIPAEASLNVFLN